MDQIKGRNKLRYQSKANIEADISRTKRELKIESSILKFRDCWSSHESTPGSFKIDNYLSPLNQVLKSMPWCTCIYGMYLSLNAVPGNHKELCIAHFFNEARTDQWQWQESDIQPQQRHNLEHLKHKRTHHIFNRFVLSWVTVRSHTPNAWHMSKDADAVTKRPLQLTIWPSTRGLGLGFSSLESLNLLLQLQELQNNQDMSQYYYFLNFNMSQ